MIPVFTLDIVDATLRFALDEGKSSKQVFSISIKYIGIGLALSCAFSIANAVFGISKTISEYSIYFVCMFLSISANGVISAFARGTDKVKEASIAGVIGTAITVALNILFLLPLKMGLHGYFLATILGYFSQTIYLIFTLKVWRYIGFKKDSKGLNKEMICFSRPLIINNVSWWINNASDRYIVTFFCGVAQNGIYSIGYKIPTILSVFQSIFQQAWMISAVHDFDKDDTDGFFSNTYKIYNFGMVFVCAGLILFDKFLARLFYAKEFYVAWRYVPVLTIGFVFVAIANYIGGVFQAVKDTKIITLSTLIGAGVNTLLNFVLVYSIGAFGAALATCISYYVVWIIRIVYVKKYISLHINIFKDHIGYVLLISQTIVCELSNGIISYLIQIIFIGLLLILYRNETTEIVKRAFKR